MEQEPIQKPWKTMLIAFTLLICFILGSLLSSGTSAQVSAAATLELPEAQPAAVAAASLSVPKTVIPLGRAVGIKLFSDGVLVVGLSDLETQAGGKSPGQSCGLRAGDVITHINGQEVDTIEEVQTILKEDGDQPLTLRTSRSGKMLQMTTQAIQNSQGNYQLGVWLRDSMAGIGTMTFYDPESGTFAALGHGINDVDTAQIMPMETGSIMYASVSDVKKGASGAPGELHGTFDVEQDLGTLFANTECGIYGKLTREDFAEVGVPMEIASRSEVKTGPATIRSNVTGEDVQEFDVEITHVYPESEGETRNLMIHVKDPELMKKTGGIVQGMSGSPIVQNGKLVGAVTHVLVNDPTRGYGIFIENMLDAAG